MENKPELKFRVLEEIEKQKKSIESYRSMSEPISPDDAIGRVSRMDSINNKSVVEAALRESEIRLKKLEKVIENIEQSDFGICRKCHKPLPEGRFMIVP